MIAGRLSLSLAAESTDEQLVAAWQEGDGAALELLLRRYRRLARAKAHTYFLVGADADDVEQEGLIGLYKAARDFRPDHQVSFRAFAELCMTRQVISAVKSATRHKHRPLNQYLSFSAGRSQSGPDGREERPFDDLLGDRRVLDPADEVVSHERVAALRRSMTEGLSRLEVEVLRLYVAGKSYDEIGRELGRRSKSIDNALQRIKRKLDHELADRDDRSVPLVA
jgi:RNA polymerase sporulation-specific sigma factor